MIDDLNSIYIIDIIDFYVTSHYIRELFFLRKSIYRKGIEAKKYDIYDIWRGK